MPRRPRLGHDRGMARRPLAARRRPCLAPCLKEPGSPSGITFIRHRHAPCFLTRFTLSCINEQQRRIRHRISTIRHRSMSVFPLFGRRRARLSFMPVYPNLVYPGYAGTVMSVHPDPVNPSQLLYRHLAPTRGLPPDISPRSWRGSAASDEGPRQVYPRTQHP